MDQLKCNSKSNLSSILEGMWHKLHCSKWHSCSYRWYISSELSHKHILCSILSRISSQLMESYSWRQPIFDTFHWHQNSILRHIWRKHPWQSRIHCSCLIDGQRLEFLNIFRWLSPKCIQCNNWDRNHWLNCRFCTMDQLVRRFLLRWGRIPFHIQDICWRWPYHKFCS